MTNEAVLRKSPLDRVFWLAAVSLHENCSSLIASAESNPFVQMQCTGTPVTPEPNSTVPQPFCSDFVLLTTNITPSFTSFTTTWRLRSSSSQLSKRIADFPLRRLSEKAEVNPN